VFTAARGQLDAGHRNFHSVPPLPASPPMGQLAPTPTQPIRPSAALAVDTAEPSPPISSADGDLLTAIEAPRRVGTRAIDGDEAQHRPQYTSAPLPCQSIQH
jgi:hypothetical protein